MDIQCKEDTTQQHLPRHPQPTPTDNDVLKNSPNTITDRDAVEYASDSSSLQSCPQGVLFPRTE